MFFLLNDGFYLIFNKKEFVQCLNQMVQNAMSLHDMIKIENLIFYYPSE